MTMQNYQFILAKEKNDFDKGKELFLEYTKSKKFDLSYQNFDTELNKINIQYSFPAGGLILIQDNNNNYVGCGGIRKHKDSIAELKRMYIKPDHRGKGLGKKLLVFLIELVKKLGYKKIWLDTLESLKEATHIYRNFGFIQIDAYRYNPNPDVLYFELELKNNKN